MVHYADISSGKASPRRRPPPPPQRSQSGIGRTSSTAQTPRGSASPREGMQQQTVSPLAGQQASLTSLTVAHFPLDNDNAFLRPRFTLTIPRHRKTCTV